MLNRSNKKANKFSMKFFLVLVMCILQPSIAATMEQQVKGAQAVGGLCKAYAEEIGRDSSHLSELNTLTIKAAEKLGYTDDFEKYKSDVSNLQELLDKKLKKIYPSVQEIYGDWCRRFYLAYIKRVTKK